MGQFGDKFRKAREGKELTLDDVSNVIKIGPRMLQAIEEENFDRLPGGVFNKGFIRAYSKHLGLNPDETIAEYLETVRQAQVAAQQAWEPAAAPEVAPPAKEIKDDSKPVATVSTKTSPPAPAALRLSQPAVKPQPPAAVQTRQAEHPAQKQETHPARKAFTPPPEGSSSWKLFVVAGIIFILGITLWLRRSQTGNPAAAYPNQASAKAPAVSSSAPATSPAPTMSPQMSDHAARSTPVTSAALLQSPPANSQPPKASAPAVTQPALNASAGTTNVASKPQNRIEEKSDVTIRTFGNSAPPVNAATPKAPDTSIATFTLTIRATENSWLSIVADGQPVRQETLIAPAHTSVHASREIVVKVGNAAGVSFLFNGKEISAQGNEAEAKTLVFDSSGLKIAP